MGGTLKLDEVGPWSEVKLDIIREYAVAYSTILTAQKNLSHVYIDAFAGAGIHVSKTTKQFIPGSPTNALLVEPPFDDYFFIDMDRVKVNSLYEIAGDRKDVHIYEGDCNPILLERIFPKVRYENYKRALCILDPYGLHLDWKVMETAGKMESMDIFINFPIMDINMNVLHHDPENVDEKQADRMNRFWGDDSWRQVAYEQQRTLFGFRLKKQRNEALVAAFSERLKKIAGFTYVPIPMAMKNRSNAVVYYLFFASQKNVAKHIIENIFDKYGR